MPKKPSLLKRSGVKRTPNQRILIVCEGEKTEPHYLRELIQALGINPQSAGCKIIDSRQEGAGSAPISIFRKAVAEFNLDKDYDKVYCVFDRDTHETYEPARASIRSTKLIKSNLERGKKSLAEFIAITSDPRFEYWLLLHFERSTQLFSQPGDIENKLKRYIPNYKKDTKGLFSEIKGLLFGSHGAFKNSSDCRRQVQSGDAETPITKMDELVRQLIIASKKEEKDLIADWGEASKPYTANPAVTTKKRR